MCAPTFDSILLSIANVVGKQAVLGLDYEVELLLAVLLDDLSPIRVVVAERRRNFEPSWKLAEHFHRIVCFKLLGEVGLGSVGGDFLDV